MSQIDDPEVAVGDGDESPPKQDPAATGAAADGKGSKPAKRRNGRATTKASVAADRSDLGDAGEIEEPEDLDVVLDESLDAELDAELEADAEARGDLDPDADVEDTEDLEQAYAEFWGEDDEIDPDLDDPDDEVDAAAGTAPAPKKLSRHRKRKQWRQSERARRYAARRSVRFPIFTRSVLLWMLLFAMTGAAFGGSGAFFWAHFNTEIQELREQTTDFDKRSQEARAEIDSMRNQAVTDINNQLKPIAPFLAEANTIKQAETVSPFVWFVATLDENGNPAVGSAFSVATDENTTLMITSYNTVKAGAVTPAPPIGVRKGQEEIPARVVSFDPDRDLALIEVQRANMPVLEWASDADQAAGLGLRVFPVSGLGGTGAALTSGIIIDQSEAGLLHTAPVGAFMQGGPIITADYKVIGVASTAYRPLGFDPGEIHYSVQINTVCAVLMECGGGARKKKP